jgi:hypothetical protein
MKCTDRIGARPPRIRRLPFISRCLDRTEPDHTVQRSADCSTAQAPGVHRARCRPHRRRDTRHEDDELMGALPGVDP